MNEWYWTGNSRRKFNGSEIISDFFFDFVLLPGLRIVYEFRSDTVPVVVLNGHC